ncbi:DUF1501 domain-containing protein [Granulicella tundricola]|uniref:DUF1501 domain-containing protein n=1 Tax=Granulicella tundricola (strain ATCC BAA-1859 / DSM 23138 / MP5ACTX9) TaxID=1198114 RepID=E8WXK6_GRATM|nr:DUF1501 domain-containing protein [Granulicella tundricola]ADW68622.1 protein of unknown function DUF1501 [Granulicella tundricola MP5ACTX9]
MANIRQTLMDRSDWGCDMQGRDVARRGLAGGATRRGFMKGGALALIGTSVIPGFLLRSVMAEATTAAASNKRLVVLFQRGAADGLNIVVPYQEKNYYAMRPTIAIQQKDVLDLNGFFGLHPAMAAFKPLYDQGHLAVIHAAGSTDTTRSHFDAQDFMESGTPGVKSTQDGWLNRALLAGPVPAGAPSAFRAVALGTQVPRTLQGKMPAIAVSNLADFSVGGKGPTTSAISNAFQAMYDESSDAVLHGTGQETFEAVKMLKAADPAHYQPAAGVTYPNTPFGNSLKQIAQLMKANLGVEAAFSDIGGWDTHQNQGAATGQLANRLTEFANGIAAFWKDMGDGAENITLVTMSEFGRTAKQNGTGGTDHGHANAMFVLGGTVKGGKVYGKWPGLDNAQLNEGRDLAVTTDFRRVLGEAAYKTLGARKLETVFPGAQLDPSGFLNFV